ncbi:MAG TPA: ABC transporter permease, partial [Thermoanaerobaculia bacterium]|nr:ABC transporter permease [Thermoanaerobaculia bacterium]
MRTSLPFLETLAHDARFGLRLLRRSPAFTITAVLTLALGIGANTAIWSVVSAVMIRPLPVEAPDELVSLRNAAGGGMFNTFAYPDYEDIRDAAKALDTAFSDLMAYRLVPVAVSHDGTSQRVWAYMVSGNYFTGLGLRPHVGRLLLPEDDLTPGAHPVAVLGHDSWQKRFGSRPDIVGLQIVVNGRAFTIVGVGPRGFSGTEVVAAPEIWFPAAMQQSLEPGTDLLAARDAPAFFVLARVADGVSRAQVQANLDSIGQGLAAEHPRENEGMRILLAEAGILGGGTFRTASIGFAALLMAVAALVLVLTCANLSNLLLARATERRGETAIRLALGASRGRLSRQLLTESTMLALAGGLLGMLPTLWPLSLSLQMKPPADFPIRLDVHWDYRVLAFGFGVTLSTGILFGLLPALRTTRADVAPTLVLGRAAGPSRTWISSTLIRAQVALSIVLLTGAGLMLRGLQQARTLDLGFDPDGAVEAGFDLRMQGYDAARGREMQKLLLERVRALPGVEAGLTDLVPPDLHFPSALVFVEGAPEERTASTPRALRGRASPGFLGAMGTRLVAGRDLSDDDVEGRDLVALVNQTFARRFWPAGDPIGKRFSLGDPTSPRMTVVGVVEDAKYNSLDAGSPPFVYGSLWQSYSGPAGLVARGELPDLVGAVRREIATLDPHLPVNAAPLAERLAVTLLPARVATTVLGAFALLGLALAAVGIYGVIAHAVTLRTKELGIRMALGAHRREVLALVLVKGMKPALAGALVGLPLALLATRLMRRFLYGLSPADPATYAATFGLL